MEKTEIYKIGKNLEINKKYIDKIILSVLGIDKKKLFFINEIDEKYIKDIINCFERLKNNEPLEYIIQKAEFYSLDFFIDSRVLIPRNDTEIMVEKAIKTLSLNNKNILIDVGTGSSCIAISILKNTISVKKCFVTDISKDALEVSKINIKKHNLENKITQINGNLLDNFEFDTNILCPSGDLYIGNLVITANLPYIKNQDYRNMDIGTIKYNPDIALYGGEKTGFELYENLIYQCFKLKNIYNINNFILFIEIGFDQEKYSIKYLKNLNLKFEFFKDNSGINRCIKIIF